MPELQQIMNELPPELQDQEDADGGIATATDDESTGEEDTATEGDADEDADEGADENQTDDDTADEDEDYEIEEDEPEAPAPTTTAPEPKLPELTDEGSYILQNLNKIKTSILVAGPDGKDVTQQVEVYGWGQLLTIPGYKGFATPIDQGNFIANAQHNENEARRLQGEFQQKKMAVDLDAYTKKENRMIAEDLQELRRDGVFPKFKGVPNSKEFNESAGAKEFDRVISFMNKQNKSYGDAANTGKAFRHIGFKEAYIMLNGPFQKVNAKKEQDSRRTVAAKIKGGDGTKRDGRNVKTAPVSNINDLADEFAAFSGSNG